ncbi:MAG: cobalamin biosynthesis protein [Methylococcales symbiont of Hymedesmia sp. n. MRB-2018]|nr:MAG: cobalamin biosynthesis protein [Methylococcales symbiont of Hymedesmia sp. n. MRB-2018]KAF3982902.1 MAG: cobalamin biosynthesis protein [Methylococcales symbiont of Hymedesmia sp. n. MRB-2018]
MSLTFTIILAVLLDQWLGEPKKYHPLVFFGDYAQRIETCLNKPSCSTTQIKSLGLFALILLIIPLSLLPILLNQWYWLNLICAPVILYFCIAAKSLRQHANAVFIALNNNDLDLAKQKVAMIVSRQTEKMSADDIRRATIESILENGADAVFAPLFWFIVAGPAGAILYRLSNTLDAMWGYKNQRYLYFGWAAARFDDILNWIPARLTALSYSLLGHRKLAFNCWQQQAHLLNSPNAGPVMTAGAGALNIQLGGPAWYHHKLKNKIFFGTTNTANDHDIEKANKLITHSLYLWIFIVIITQALGESLA